MVNNIDEIETNKTHLMTVEYLRAKVFFKKMGQSRPLYVYFRHFLTTISIIEKA